LDPQIDILNGGDIESNPGPLLSVPKQSPLIDITLSGDIEKNPGPESGESDPE